MNILAFDTCFSACSVAVGTRAGRVESEHREMETGHAEALMPMIERVMARAGLAFADLDRIVVTNGPGTFTGVRTGVAAARALALSTGAEIVAVSSLWLIGAAALEAAPAAEIDGILVAMDARKGQLYVEIVSRSEATLAGPLLLTAEQAAGLLPGHKLIAAGTGAEMVAMLARQAGRSFAPSAVDQTSHQPKHLLRAAGRSSIAGGQLRPLYLRPPDAKPQADKSLPWSPR